MLSLSHSAHRFTFRDTVLLIDVFPNTGLGFNGSARSNKECILVHSRYYVLCCLTKSLELSLACLFEDIRCWTYSLRGEF